MKYRTKLYLGIGSLVLFLVILIETFNYFESRNRYYNDLKSKIHAIASTGAVLIDKEDIAALTNNLNEQNPAYQNVITQLRQIRDANRHHVTYVSYIYLLKPDLKDPKAGFLIVADASKEKGNPYFAPPGTPYPEAKQFSLKNHLDRAYSPGFIEDRWGRFFTAYAPVFGANGKYVATLGLSLTSSSVEKRLSHIRWLSIGFMVIGLSLGIFIAYFLAKKITDSLSKIYAGISKIEKGDLQTGMEVSSQDEFANLEYAINTMARGIEEKEQSKLNLMRYVSRATLQKILESGRTPDLSGEMRKITVLFTDIRDFGLLTDRLSPKEIVSILNQFFDKMIDVLNEYDGTFDKYIGDGLMAIFGAPLEEAHKEDLAIEAAKKMQAALDELNKQWDQEGFPQLKMYIGIHTDEAIIGNMGSRKRQEYSAFGPSVRIAARLVEVALQLDVPILISGATWEGTHKSVKVKKLGPLHVKRKKDPIDIYCVGLHGEDCN